MLVKGPRSPRFLGMSRSRAALVDDVAPSRRLPRPSTRSTPSALSPFTNCSPIRTSRSCPVQRKSLALMSGGSTVSPIRIASATYANG